MLKTVFFTSMQYSVRSKNIDDRFVGIKAALIISVSAVIAFIFRLSNEYFFPHCKQPDPPFFKSLYIVLDRIYFPSWSCYVPFDRILSERKKVTQQINYNDH